MVAKSEMEFRHVGIPPSGEYGNRTLRPGFQQQRTQELWTYSLEQAQTESVESARPLEQPRDAISIADVEVGWNQPHKGNGELEKMCAPERSTRAQRLGELNPQRNETLKSDVKPLAMPVQEHSQVQPPGALPYISGSFVSRSMVFSGKGLDQAVPSQSLLDVRVSERTSSEASIHLLPSDGGVEILIRDFKRDLRLSGQLLRDLREQFRFSNVAVQALRVNGKKVTWDGYPSTKEHRNGN